VFSVPSRRAIYAADYREACSIAQATSDPPRKVSKQLFNIARKSARWMSACHPCAAPRRCFEVHPELAFWRLNGSGADRAKEVKSRPYGPAGAAAGPAGGGGSRRSLRLAAAKGAARRRPARCAGCAAIARRIHAGRRTVLRTPPRDAFGLRWPSGHKVC
jgi:predicted RNase H-like nuclease